MGVWFGTAGCRTANLAASPIHDFRILLFMSRSPHNIEAQIDAVKTEANNEAKNDAKTPGKETLFARVTRESQERRAQSDRRSAARRATELAEISKQLSARTPMKKPQEPERPPDVDDACDSDAS